MGVGFSTLVPRLLRKPGNWAWLLLFGPSDAKLEPMPYLLDRTFGASLMSLVKQPISEGGSSGERRVSRERFQARTAHEIITLQTRAPAMPESGFLHLGDGRLNRR
jgi:hypothetical protein